MIKRVVFCVSILGMIGTGCKEDEPLVIAKANEIEVEPTSTATPPVSPTTPDEEPTREGRARASIGGSRAPKIAKPQTHPPAFKDLPAPSPDALERIRSEHLIPTSVTVLSPDSDWAFAGIGGADAKSPSAQRKTPTGALTMGPVQTDDSWLFGKVRRTTLRWKSTDGELTWERTFRLGRECEMGWSLDALVNDDRVYVVSFNSPMRLTPIPARHGPCQGKVTITLLDQNTGDIINTATVPRTPLGFRFSHDGAGHIALHERWTYLPGNQCDDGPCTQRIEQMFIFDEATLERTHHFEEVGAFE